MWDCEQLIKQMEPAIDVFKEAHPGKQGLDNSSAHASLATDALRAFDMNMSDGGKQHRQKDTVIPDTNPDAQHRGKVQKMTNEAGQAKGLKTVLEEWGFNVKKMQAKCKPVCLIENKDCCMTSQKPG